MAPQTIRVDLGTRANAEWARETFPDAITDDDDRRKNTVPFDQDELTERELDEIVAVAEGARAERSGPGQTALTESERDRIDFSDGRASIPHARSVKGIMLSEGVDDWTAFYDPTLTVDEHRQVAEQAARDVRGERLDVREEDDPRGQLESALAEQCDHARGVCRRGDPDACEFLGEACGFDEDDIDRIMGIDVEETDDAAEDVDVPFSGPQLGALRRSWGGYQGAVNDMAAALAKVGEAEEHARDAIEAVNAIRAGAGQEPIEPYRLNELLEFDRDEDERTPRDVIERDKQRDLGGGLSDAQARLAGGETGERGQGEVEVVVEENPGGLMADERAATSSGQTEQKVPDEFRVAEGGQDTL